jgi:outer membrane lipoprotein-sorting protein
MVFAMANLGQAATPVSEQTLAEKLKFYASVSTLEVDFKQTKTLKDMNLQLKSEGHLKLRRPDHLVWEITKPSPVFVSLDDQEIRIRSGKGADAQTQTFKISDAPSGQGMKSLTGLITWLSLDSKALADQYSIYALGQQSFRFEPKKKDVTPFESLEMTLGGDGHLKHLTLNELSGDRLDIEFGKPKLTSR